MCFIANILQYCWLNSVYSVYHHYNVNTKTINSVFVDLNFRARKEMILTEIIMECICIYIYDLKHPRSRTTGNWLSYTVFNTIYGCLLYLKVWSDSSGVHYLGMTTCTVHEASWSAPTGLEQAGHFQFHVIKLFSLGVDYKAGKSRATLVSWADLCHKYLFLGHKRRFESN